MTSPAFAGELLRPLRDASALTLCLRTPFAGELLRRTKRVQTAFERLRILLAGRGRYALLAIVVIALFACVPPCRGIVPPYEARSNGV